MTHPLVARESVIARFHPAYRRTTDTLNNLGWLPNFVLRLTVGFMFFSGAFLHYARPGTGPASGRLHVSLPLI
jgi:hypothetical protein